MPNHLLVWLSLRNVEMHQTEGGFSETPQFWRYSGRFRGGGGEGLVQDTSVRHETVDSKPEFSQRPEVFPVSTGDCEFLTAPDAQPVIPGRKRTDFFYKGSVHQHRPMNSNKSIGLELAGHLRNGFPRR